MFSDIIADPGGLTELVVRVVIAMFLLVVSIPVSAPLAGFVTRTLFRRGPGLDADKTKRIGAPLRLSVIAAFGFGAVAVLQLWDLAQSVAIKILVSMIIVSLFWTVIRVVDLVGDIFTGIRDVLGDGIYTWVVKGIEAVLVIVCAAVLLEEWGVKVGAIIAGLGIFGLALSLGAQDLFRNLISGASILIEKRFDPGNWIRVDGVVEGVVVKINFRSTLIQRFDKAPVHVPNSMLSDAPVTNFSRMTHRRIKWMIGIEYGSDVEQIVRIRDAIEAYIANGEEFSGPPEVPLFVRVDRFSSSSIDILVYCFTKTTEWGQWLQIKETLAVRIKQIVEEAGTGFAFPSRTLYIRPVEDSDQASQPDESIARAPIGQTTESVSGKPVAPKNKEQRADMPNRGKPARPKNKDQSVNKDDAT